MGSGRGRNKSVMDQKNSLLFKAHSVLPKPAYCCQTTKTSNLFWGFWSTGLNLVSIFLLVCFRVHPVALRVNPGSAHRICSWQTQGWNGYNMGHWDSTWVHPMVATCKAKAIPLCPAPVDSFLNNAVYYL